MTFDLLSSWRARGASRRAALGLLARSFPRRTVGLVLLCVLAGVLPAVFAALVGRLVGQLESYATLGRAVPSTLALMAVTLVVTEVVTWIRDVVQTDLYRRFDERLLSRLMATVLAQPQLEPFEDQELSAARDRAVRVARFGPGELTSGLSLQVTARASGFAAAALVAVTLSWPAAVVLIGLWLIVGEALRTTAYAANPFWTDPLRRATYLKRLGLLPAAAKELRIFGLGSWLVARFSGEWTAVMASLSQARRLGRWLLLTLLGLILLGNGAVLAFAVHEALGGRISLAVLTIVLQGLFAMSAIASQVGDIYIENGAVPIPDLLAFEKLLPKPAGVRAPAPELRGEIRFEGVRFAYPGMSEPVFAALDLIIPAGRSLAIVGLNGAGKTTLVKLLAGLVQAQGGRVLVDGVDLAGVDPVSWHRQLAVLFQDFVHYELSCRENVGFGAVERLDRAGNDAEIRTALDRAGALSLVASLPDGLNTPLSRRYPGGVDLSGGEWQRIALARALLAVGAGARVLCLDEPAAQLDARAEADLYERFLDLTQGLTSIVISHRFSTVRRADRIVVLERGRVVEDGSHDELVAEGGRYARLFTTQAQPYREGTDG